MGYKVLYGNQLLFDPYTDDRITDTKLSAKLNAASYFDFTIAPTHSLYSKLMERAGEVRIYFNNLILFKGEIVEIEEDFEGNYSVSCTGVLDYLNATLVRPYSTVEGEQPLKAPSSYDGYFQWLIDQHNSNCLDSRKYFSVGVNQGNMLDKNNYIYRSSEQRPTTASEIEDKILNSAGGYLFVRYKDDLNIVDLYADIHDVNTQIIDYGVNILDLTKTTTAEGQYTAVVATGYTPDPPEGQADAKMKPITLEGCMDGGTPYSSTIVKMGDRVYDVEAVNRYGYHEYYASNTDITNYDDLLYYACKTLNALLSPALTISVKAVDLALIMGDKYRHLQLGQAVRIRSKPRKVDEYLMVNSIDIDLMNPENTTFDLGASYDTLTGQQSTYLKALNASINSSLDSVAALDQATKNAAKDAKDATEKANTANTNAIYAVEKADTATNTANSAVTKAEEATTKAETATNAANSAVSKAETATTKATDASAKASEATTKAEDAVAKANEATTKANLVENKAEEAKSAADSAKQAADEANTAAATAQDTADTAKANAKTAQDTADTAKANAKTAQNDVNALKGRVTSAETSIKQNSDAIALRATKTEVTNAIAGINVGGRNLARNTSNEWSDWITPKANSTNVTASSGSIIYFPTEINVGDDYYIQCEVEFDNVTPSDGKRSHFALQGSVDGKWEANKFNPWHDNIYNIKNGITKFSKKATSNIEPTPAEVFADCAFRVDNWATGRYRWRRIKVEVGNKATDWSPAPEDLVAESKTYTDAQIKVSADSITSTVSKTYLTNIDANKTYASSSRVADLESRVTQNANSITANFQTISKQIDDKTAVVNAWVSEGSDGTNPYLELGTNKSELKTRLTNSELAFMDGFNKVAYISNNSMSITNANIDVATINQLSIFPYQLTVKNGHLLIQHIGG